MRGGHECNGGQSSPGSPFYGDLAQRRWWTRGGETWRSPISRSAGISVLRLMARCDAILSCHQPISNPCRGPVVHRAWRDASNGPGCIGLRPWEISSCTRRTNTAQGICLVHPSRWADLRRAAPRASGLDLGSHSQTVGSERPSVVTRPYLGVPPGPPVSPGSRRWNAKCTLEIIL